MRRIDDKHPVTPHSSQPAKEKYPRELHNMVDSTKVVAADTFRQTRTRTAFSLEERDITVKVPNKTSGKTDATAEKRFSDRAKRVRVDEPLGSNKRHKRN